MLQFALLMLIAASSKLSCFLSGYISIQRIHGRVAYLSVLTVGHEAVVTETLLRLL